MRNKSEKKIKTILSIDPGNVERAEQSSIGAPNLANEISKDHLPTFTIIDTLGRSVLELKINLAKQSVIVTSALNYVSEL
jgi:hypothetical protein